MCQHEKFSLFSGTRWRKKRRKSQIIAIIYHSATLPIPTRHRHQQHSSSCLLGQKEDSPASLSAMFYVIKRRGERIISQSAPLSTPNASRACLLFFQCHKVLLTLAVLVFSFERFFICAASVVFFTISIIFCFRSFIIFQVPLSRWMEEFHHRARWKWNSLFHCIF